MIRPPAAADPAIARASRLWLAAMLAMLTALGTAVTPAVDVVLGQDSTAVTIQDGPLNYAGPASGCPGPDWNCVTPDAFPVMQKGTHNVIVASEPEECVNNSQDGGTNTFDCTIGNTDEEQAMTPQVCTVDQIGMGHNVAICKLTHVNTTGAVQCAVQIVDIDQTGADNQMKIDMRIVQEATSGTSQVQDARQIVGVLEPVGAGPATTQAATQTATQRNQADIEQVQIQDAQATGPLTTQRQNTGCGPAAIPDSDCAPLEGKPTEPYTCVSLDQIVSLGGGSNTSKLKQEVKEEAVTTALAGVQQQGTKDGGNKGRIHQSAPMTGKNIDIADQYTQQKLVAPGGFALPVPPPQGIIAAQMQFEDPTCCGRFSQDGGHDNQEMISQWVEQLAGPDAFQEATAVGVARTPNGECTITHNIKNNGGTAQESAHEPEEGEEGCPLLIMTTTCTSGGVDEEEPSILQEETCPTIVNDETPPILT